MQLPYVLDIAIRTAVEQKDVAVLVIPGDVLLHEMDRPDDITNIRPTLSVIRPADTTSKRRRAC
jgi:pyruvate dehydrogenase (quinone)